VADFVVYTVDVRGLSVDSVKIYLFGVRALHLERGFTWVPFCDRFPVYQALRACKRLFGSDKRVMKLEMTLGILHRIWWQAISDNGERHFQYRANSFTFWAACLVLFFGLLRKDNIAVAKPNSFNPNRCICRGDFAFADSSFRLKIRWSKVIQFSQRHHEIFYVRTGLVLCPYSAVLKCFQATPQPDNQGPAFVWQVGANKFTPMTHATFVRHVKWAVSVLGLDPKDYAGISFRRGGASCLAAAGADHSLIKELGDWKSDAYARYVRREQTRRLELPALFAKLAR
jgi:hypothetical protein